MENTTDDDGAEPSINVLMELLLIVLKDFEKLGVLKEAGPHVNALMALADGRRGVWE